MFRFVEAQTAATGQLQSKQSQRIVRSHVMKRFRKAQRDRQQNALWALLHNPATQRRPLTVPIHDLEQQRDVNDGYPHDPVLHMRQDFEDDYSVCRSLVDGRVAEESLGPLNWIPQDEDNADFYLYEAPANGITAPAADALEHLWDSSSSEVSNHDSDARCEGSKHSPLEEMPLMLSDALILVSRVTTPAEIRSVQAVREQLWQTFLTSYYADSIISDFHHFISTFHNLTPRNNAMGYSQDALSLIYLGTQCQDDRLLYEGSKLHCTTLRLVCQEIEKANAIADDYLLGACYTLAHCQIFQPISHLGATWRIHMEGLYYLLRRRGPKPFESKFAQTVIHNIRQIAIMDGLLNRNKTFLSSSKWFANSTRTAKALVPEITRVALELTGLLGDVDSSITDAKAGTTDRRDRGYELIQRLKSHEDRLCQLLDNMYLTFGPLPYATLGLEELSHFEQYHSKLLSPVRRFYEFSSLVCATTHVYVWICLLVLRRSMMEVLSHDVTAENVACSAALVAEANETALHLCRSLPYLADPRHRSGGVLACSGPLHWAQSWFQQRLDSSSVQWCQGIRNSLERYSGVSFNLHQPVFTWWMLPSILDG